MLWAALAYSPKVITSGENKVVYFITYARESVGGSAAPVCGLVQSLCRLPGARDRRLRWAERR